MAPLGDLPRRIIVAIPGVSVAINSRRLPILVLVLALGAHAASAQPAAPVRPRARDLGVAPGVFPTGPLNAITDVDGVTVGHVTLVQGIASAPA